MNVTIRSLAALSLCLATAARLHADHAEHCPADFDADGRVAAADLGLLFANWSGTDGPFDLYGDGIVAGSDLAALLTAWGECPPCDAPRFVHGPAEILAELRDTRASVLLMGDSISNWNATSFRTLFQGAICTWQPEQWRGMYTSPASSKDDQGHFVAPGPLAAPGSAGIFAELASDLEGHLTGHARGRGIETGTPADSMVMRGVLRGAIFAEAIEARPEKYRFGVPFRNAAGEVDFINRPGPAEAGFTFVTNGVESADGHRYADECRIEAFNDGVSEHGPESFEIVTGTSPVLTRIGVEWTTSGLAAAGGDLELKILTGGRADVPQVMVVQDFFFGRPDHVDGLTLAYAGDGGWWTEGHVHPFGSTELPPDRRGGYSDDALRGRIAAIEASHYVIHLGANDLASPHTTVAKYLDDLEMLMARVRRLHAEAGRDSEPRFIMVGLYLTGRDDEIIDRPRKEEARTKLIERATNSTDLVYLDLLGHIEKVFDMSDIDESNPFDKELLLDRVHLNVEGADFVSSWIWSRVEAARLCVD